MKKILVLAKDIRHQGGYYEFVSMLLDRQGREADLEYFRVGRPVGSTTALGRIYSIPYDQARLASRLLSDHYRCLLFNTSMDESAFIRDSLLIMLATTLSKRRIVVQVHGWQKEFAKSIAERRPLRLLFDKSFCRADCIIVLSNRFRDQLIEMGVEDWRIRVGTSMFDGRLLERRDGVSGDAPRTLLYLSRLAKEKGVHEVLEAFAAISQRHPQTRLVVAGDGPERDALLAKAAALGIAERVTFPGYVRGRDKARLLEEADVFLLPTVYGEGLPISMLEAMAAGLAVVVTRAGAIGEWLTDTENGVLLDTNAPEEIAQAVDSLLAEPQRLREIGERNRTLAWSRFEADHVSRAVVALCEESCR